MIASGAPLGEILDVLARDLEAQAEGMLCSILLLDRDGVHLRDGAGPSLPESYRRAVDGITIGPTVGSCGTAAYRGEPVIVADIETDPLWRDYRELAREHGLRACWSTPIVSPRGEVLGTFAMYYREPRAPDQRDLELIERATHIAGIAIERVRADEALRDSEERYRELFENANDIAYTHDLTGRFTSFNRAAELATGYSREEAVNMNVAQIVAPEHLKRAMEMIRREGEESGRTTYELEIIAKDGRRIPLEVSTRLICREGKPVAVQGIARDITERKRAEETIRHLAFHDSLTGLANRALLIDRLSMALAQARRSGQMLAVLFLDLDGLKVVNDTLGHTAGDGVLRAIANQLRGIVRDADTMARIGGDEFVVLLPVVRGPEDAMDVARRVLNRLKQPTLLEGREFTITGSIGIAIYPHDGEDAEALLRSADLAMYRVKERGGDDYQVCTPAIHASTLERLELENELRRALQRGEFILHYQPQVDVRTGRICGVEALLRWQRGEGGLVPPQEFITVAEKAGLIVRLGEWVLRTVCAQAREWQEAGFGCIPVAVNISPRQLQQADLVETVAQVLRESGMAPTCLRLEITEGAVIQDVEATINVLRQLREMGIEISVDDFGTGYSSLSYLKRLPIDEVKIDRTFVSDVPSDADDAAIITAILALAQSLNLRVVAEGVENQQQAAFLRGRGCHIMQGYFFARPMPAHDFELLLREGGKLRATGAGPARSR